MINLAEIQDMKEKDHFFYICLNSWKTLKKNSFDWLLQKKKKTEDYYLMTKTKNTQVSKNG
jgi:hypothetical protein